MKQKLILGIIFCVFCLACSGCGSGSDSKNRGSSDGGITSTEIDPAPYAVSVAQSASTYNETDIVHNIVFDYSININFTDNTVQLSAHTPQTITTDGVTPLAVDGTSVTVTRTSNGITVSSTVVANVKYTLSGTLNGTLTVTSSSVYQLCLNGVVINGLAGPALDFESSQKVYIVATSGTVNTLADSSTRNMTMKAALYGKGPMIFSGDGTISVAGSYKHGIFSNDYIRVCGTTLNVTVSSRDAVRSVNGFIFDDGKLTINAMGTTTNDESKGIKVEGSEVTGTGKGYIVINGGYIAITSVGKAITAGWDIDEDADTANTSDDPDPYIEVNNGVITITTTGTPYEYKTPDGTVSCSPEGIEAKSDLTINSGYIRINTTDDSLNAGKSININGGYLFCASSKNDAIDSNGTITIAGGIMVAIGSSSPEGPFDSDVNTFAITGGTFVGIGGRISKPTASFCTQNVLIIGSIAEGNTMAVKASNGKVAFAFTIPESYKTMILSSPDIVTGTEYSLYSAGTASANNIFYGLHLGRLRYSGGIAGSIFTVSSNITKLGGYYFPD